MIIYRIGRQLNEINRHWKALLDKEISWKLEFLLEFCLNLTNKSINQTYESDESQCDHSTRQTQGHQTTHDSWSTLKSSPEFD